jgi:tRNA (cmo5U34)-methyltransferase
MQQEELTAQFDKQATSYDQQWAKMAAINDALHLLMGGVLADLPQKANVLCVGVGTGAEVLYLAKRNPEWRFTAVEPSTAMMAVFRRRADEHQISSRCVFHTGYLDTLPAGGVFDAATAFLVSQFMMERSVRSTFFQSIADRLGTAGILISSDLAGDMAASNSQKLLDVWFRVMTGNGALPTQADIERMRTAYSRDVAVLPPAAVQEIIALGGFDTPALFYQAGMIHAWFAKRSARQTLKPD